MSRHLFVSIAMSGAAACASAAPMVSVDHPEAAQTPAAKPVTTSLLRTGTTISGQPLKLPQGPAEMAAAAVDLPAGARLPLHRHPWSRFVYVEKGRVAIHNRVTGATVEAAAGQALAEVVAQWHEAEALDGAAARLVVFDLVPPGVVNMEMPPK